MSPHFHFRSAFTSTSTSNSTSGPPLLPPPIPLLRKRRLQRLKLRPFAVDVQQSVRAMLEGSPSAIEVLRDKRGFDLGDGEFARQIERRTISQAIM
jgi:hypothetical protein